MSPEQICIVLTDEFGEAVVATRLDTPHPHAVIRADAWPAVARFLCDDERMGFNMFRSVSALDLPDDSQLAAVYDLIAMQPGDGPDAVWTCPHAFAIRIVVDRDAPHIPSVADVWPGGDWHEREAYDMMGIVFDGHPDLRRILCPDDWEGYPLRKDYVFPRAYHDIPGTTEYDSPNPVH